MKSDGFAAQLSKELGVDVVSPTKDAWVDDMGNVFASSSHFDHARGDFSPGWPPNGDWVTFKPDGTSSKHDKPTPPGTTPTWGDDAQEGPPRAWRRGEPADWARGQWRPMPPPGHRPPHPGQPTQGWGNQQRPPMLPPRPMQAPPQHAPQWGTQQRPPMPPPGPGPRGNAPLPPRPAPWQQPTANQGHGPVPGRQQPPPPMPMRQEPPPRPTDQGVRQQPANQGAPQPAPERRWERSPAPVHPAPIRPELRADVQWFRSDGAEVLPHRQEPPAVKDTQQADLTTPHQEPARQPATDKRTDQDLAPQETDPTTHDTSDNDQEPGHHDEGSDGTHESPNDTADDRAEDADNDSPDGTADLVDEISAAPEPEAPTKQSPADRGDLSDLFAKLNKDQSKWAAHGDELRANELAKGATDHRGTVDPAARAFGVQAAPEGAAIHFEDVSPNAVWRIDGEPLNRMDSRHPSEVDEAGGFHVRPDKEGGDTHQQIANNTGRMVSTTRDEAYFEVVQYGKNPPRHGDVKWNYKIDAPGGLDLLATLREDGNHSMAMQADWEAEIGFVGGIDRKHIRYAAEVKWDDGEKKWIPTGEIYHFGTKEKDSDV